MKSKSQVKKKLLETATPLNQQDEILWVHHDFNHVLGLFLTYIGNRQKTTVYSFVNNLC